MRHFSPGRPLWFGVGLLLLVCLAGVSWRYRQERNSAKHSRVPELVKAFWVRIYDDESIEYEWKVKVIPGFYRDEVFYRGYLIRTINGVPHRYFVSEDSYMPSTVQLRVNKEGNIWLEQTDFENPKGLTMRVSGSLDRKTGRFINNYGTVVDWRLPDDKQESLERPRIDNTGYTKEQPYPAWAQRSSGTVLCRSGKFVLQYLDEK